MNIKNVLKFLPVAILTATYSTNGTEDKHNTNIPNTNILNTNTPNITNNNNYYSPVSNTNNTYYNNDISNQYPMYYGTLPTFLQPGFQLYQYPQFAQHPNIQNCQPIQPIQTPQDCYFMCPVFDNINQSFNNQKFETPKYMNKNRFKNKGKKNIYNFQQYNIHNSDSVKEKLNIDSKEYIDEKNKLDNFFTISNSYDIKHESEDEQLSSTPENDSIIQSIQRNIFSIIDEADDELKAKRNLRNYINNCINNNKYKDMYNNKYTKDLINIIKKISNKKRYKEQEAKKEQNIIKKQKYTAEQISKLNEKLLILKDIMFVEKDVLKFFKQFIEIKNYISNIKSYDKKDILQKEFNRFVINLQKKNFNETDNVYINIYNLLLESYYDKTSDNTSKKDISFYKTYYWNNLWKLSKYKEIISLHHNNNKIIQQIIEVTNGNFDKQLKKCDSNKTTKKPSNVENQFIQLNNDYIKILASNSDIEKEFIDMRQKYEKLKSSIKKTNQSINNREVLIHQISLIQDDITENIKLLLNIVCSKNKQEDEKEEFTSIKKQNNNKNLSINQVNSINLNYHNDSSKKKIKMKHYINTNEIIKQYIKSLYRDKKKYNNLIKKFENDMKNKQINISSMSEQNIESYFIDYISQDISNIISATQSFRIRHKTTHIGK